MRYWAVISSLLLAGGIFLIDTGLSQAHPMDLASYQEQRQNSQQGDLFLTAALTATDGNQAGQNMPVSDFVKQDGSQKSDDASSQNKDSASNTPKKDLAPAKKQEGMTSSTAMHGQPNKAIDGQETNMANVHHQFSPFAMFAQADWVVKAVMAGLLALSALTWIIFIAKTWELKSLYRQANRVLYKLAKSPNLSSAVKMTEQDKGASAELVLVAAQEMEHSQIAVKGAGEAGLKERVDSLLTTIQLKGRRRAAKTIGIVATVGSVSPFIGLFGTVWGIMNSFIGIAETQSTGLSTVAPGIAEALLATAIGLFAAIPATVMYNNFVRTIAAYKHSLTDIAAVVERLVSRDLDFATAGIQNKTVAGEE